MKKEIATFAGGCFWCSEAIFKRLKGVVKVTPGYSGGHLENPTYEAVSSGVSGHAEAIQIEFDPSRVSYNDLLYIFWRTHDPTTPNRQGADVGSQYRSLIFYHSKDQKDKAFKSQKLLAKEKIYSIPIVTEIVPFKKFYSAEDYHKDYYAKNISKPYCTLVINPKLSKLKKEFARFLK